MSIIKDDPIAIEPRSGTRLRSRNVWWILESDHARVVEAADRMAEFMSHTTECLFSSKPCFCGHDEILAAYEAAKKGEG